MVQFSVMLKDVLCIFKIEDRVISMNTAGTGDTWFRLGTPENMKKEVLLSRNKAPKILIQFINAWKPEDIEKVAKMTTDEEMMEDMKKDFRMDGHQIIGE